MFDFIPEAYGTEGICKMDTEIVETSENKSL